MYCASGQDVVSFLAVHCGMLETKFICRNIDLVLGFFLFKAMIQILPVVRSGQERAGSGQLIRQ